MAKLREMVIQEPADDIASELTFSVLCCLET